MFLPHAVAAGKASVGASSMINVFGHKIPNKLNACLASHTPVDTYVNLYVKLTDHCNANCKFCTFKNHKDKLTFDKYKFFYVLSQIQKNVRIAKVSFTGGEPTTFTNELVDAIKMVHEFNPDIEIHVSTNGFLLEPLIPIANYITSFAISRHHYDDDENKKIFSPDSTFFPKLSDIRQFVKLVGKNKVHISCNLMKDYIDIEEHIYKFLTVVSAETGANDFGFVGLMNLTDYAVIHNVSIDEIDFESIENTQLSREYANKKICKCRNYLSIMPDGEIVKFYVRQTFANECENMLVFDKNELKFGFSGKILFS